MATADLTVISIVLLAIAVIDAAGWKTRFGLMYLIAGVLGLFDLGQLLVASAVNNFSGVPLSNSDLNLIGVVVILATIASFIMIFAEKNART